MKKCQKKPKKIISEKNINKIWGIKMLKITKRNIEVKFKEYSDTFNVELQNIWDKLPDCKIGHFGYNKYFRTPYGMKFKRYRNLKTLWQAIQKVSKRNNLTPISIGIKRNYKYYPLLGGQYG